MIISTDNSAEFRSFWLEFFHTPWTPEGEVLVRDRAWKYTYGGTGATSQAEYDARSQAALFCRVRGIEMFHYHSQEGASMPRQIT
jgi:hypothetical protein